MPEAAAASATSMPRQPRRRRWVALVLVTAVGALLVQLAWPGALHSGGTVHAPTVEGDVVYVGWAGAVRAPIQVLAISPVPGTEGLQTSVQVCAGGSVGVARGDEIDEHCERLEPAGFGTELAPLPPRGHGRDTLVVALTSTQDGPQVLCGVRVLYRTGVRLGYARRAGPSAVIGAESPDPAAESTHAVDKYC